MASPVCQMCPEQRPAIAQTIQFGWVCGACWNQYYVAAVQRHRAALAARERYEQEIRFSFYLLQVMSVYARKGYYR